MHSQTFRLFVLVAATLVVAACVTPSFAPLVEQRPWLEIETEHFQIVSDEDEAKSLRIARELELFHRFNESLIGRRFAPPFPTRVFLFHDASTYRRFVPERDGILRLGGRYKYLAIGPLGEDANTAAAFFDYAGYMLAQEGVAHYPLWYQLGYAEFMRTATLSDGRLELGKLPLRQADVLQLVDQSGGLRSMLRQGEARGSAGVPILPLLPESLIRPVQGLSRAQVDQLRATSWLLTHYLYFSKTLPDAVDRWKQRETFLERIRQGEDPTQAFETAFGVEVAALQKDLVQYLKKPLPLYQVPVEKIGPIVEPRLRIMSAAESLTRLAQLVYIGSGSVPATESMLERARELDPGMTRATSLLARVRFFQERYREADALFDQALREEPSSALTHIDRGIALSTRLLRRRPDLSILFYDLPAAERAEILEKSRRELERAIALDPNSAEAYAQLAALYLVPGQNAELGIPHAERALTLLPSNEYAVTLVAELRIAAHQLDEAEALLRRMAPQVGTRLVGEYLYDLLERVRKERKGQLAAS